VTQDEIKILSEAPGRVTLFGEHQDYLGLPVISSAINRKIIIKGHPIEDKKVIVNLLDLNKTKKFELNRVLEYNQPREYIKSGINVFLKAGYKLKRGYNVEVTGNIPISAGLSSSSALVVAWINFLFATQKIMLSPLDLALYAFKAEVSEFNEPGGNQDHITSSFGGVVYIEQGDIPKVQQLQAPKGKFIIVNSGIPKPTLKTLARIKTEVKTSLSAVNREGIQVDLRHITIDEIERIKTCIPYYRTLVGILMIRDLTYRAVKELSKRQISNENFGKMLTEHHEILRDYLRVSHPILDKIINVGLEEGALGGKLVGSGEGGCALLYVTDNQNKISNRIRERLGLEEVFSTSISDGARITYY